MASAEGEGPLREANDAAAKWREADNRLIALLKEGNPGAVRFHQEQVVPCFNQLGSTIAKYVKYREERLAAINEEVEAVTRRTWRLTIALGLLLVATAVLLGVLLTRNISNPLAAAIQHLEQVAKGDVSRGRFRRQLAASR